MRIKENVQVFITGGTSGIGKAICLFLLEKGYKVFIIGRNPNKLKKLQEEVKVLGLEDSFNGELLDLENLEHVKERMPKIWNQYGPFHVLINNAAVGFGGIKGCDYMQLFEMIRINLNAYLYLAGYFSQQMQQDSLSGDIINIGSMSADSREAGSTGYVASKSAVQGFTESLRKEVNPLDIRVCLIEPAAVSTGMQNMSEKKKIEKIKQQEMLAAEDLAKLVYFILQQDRRITFPEIKIKALKQII
ncbi:3-ketoacyl-ACP reductase [Sphingobacterium kyonggiense]|uniref:3-ketoacyl-ACP reductase n=1 Tax=Sphingobacterium kyonggiense TaxID=714075 RepID=A0ABP7YVZ4_9SPHI